MKIKIRTVRNKMMQTKIYRKNRIEMINALEVFKKKKKKKKKRNLNFKKKKKKDLENSFSFPLLEFIH